MNDIPFERYALYERIIVPYLDRFYRRLGQSQVRARTFSLRIFGNRMYTLVAKNEAGTMLVYLYLNQMFFLRPSSSVPLFHFFALSSCLLLLGSDVRSPSIVITFPCSFVLQVQRRTEREP